MNVDQLIAEQEEIEKVTGKSKKSKSKASKKKEPARNSKSDKPSEPKRTSLDLELDRLVEEIDQTAKLSTKPRDVSDSKMQQLNEELKKMDFKTPEAKKGSSSLRVDPEHQEKDNLIPALIPSTSGAVDGMRSGLVKNTAEEVDSDEPGNKKTRKRRGRVDIFPPVKAAQLMPKSPIRPYQPPTTLSGLEKSPKSTYEHIPAHMRLGSTASKRQLRPKTKLGKVSRPSEVELREAGKGTLKKGAFKERTAAGKSSSGVPQHLPAPTLAGHLLSPGLSPPVPYATASVKLPAMPSIYKPEDPLMQANLLTQYPQEILADLDDSLLVVGPKVQQPAVAGGQSAASPGAQPPKRPKDPNSRLSKISSILCSSLQEQYPSVGSSVLWQTSQDMAGQLLTLPDKEKINRGIAALLKSFENKIDLDKLVDELQEMVLSVRLCKNLQKEDGGGLYTLPN